MMGALSAGSELHSLMTVITRQFGSYLCTQRLQGARQTTQNLGPADLRLLARVEDWALSTVLGDIAEVPELDERSPIIPLVTSTRDNCLGSGCPQQPRNEIGTKTTWNGAGAAKALGG